MKTTPTIYNETDALDVAAALQRETLASLERLRRRAAETQDVGATTLAELHAQRAQLGRILDEGDRLNAELKKTEQLQDRFSRWALKFNRRAARAEAREEIMQRKKQQSKKDDRAKRISSHSCSSTDDSSSQSSANTSTPRRSLVVKRKKKTSRAPSVKLDSTPKGVLYGIKIEDHADKFQELEENDKSIEVHLDAVGTQLDDLLTLSKAMGSETRTQVRALEEAAVQTEKAELRQKTVNNRARRFMTGKLRQENDKMFVLFGR